MKLIGALYHTVGVACAFLQDDVATDRPVVFTIAGVIIRRAREVATDNDYETVGYADFLRGVPLIIDAVDELC